MDGVESDGSEDYFSASEFTKPIRKGHIGVGSDEKLPAWRRVTAGGTLWSASPGLGDDRGRLKDAGNKTAKKKRHRQRHNSETTKDSSLINHALNGMNTLYVLWANEKLCDVVVVAEGVEFSAHGVVLATHSDYFLRLLLKEQKGTTTAMPRRISLGSLVSASGFRRLLGYMYTSELELTWATVCETLQAAYALTVTQVIQLGREFVQSYTIETCLSAMFVAEQAKLTSLFVKIRRFVLENFLAITRTKEFLQYPAEMVADLLADDSLNVSCELDVLVAAQTWIHGNGETGIKRAPVVLRHVRYQRIPSVELARYIGTDETLMNIPEIRSQLMAVPRQRSALVQSTVSNVGTGSPARNRPAGKDEDIPASSTIFSRGMLHMSNDAEARLKEVKVIDPSTSSKLSTSTPKSTQPISDKHIAQSSQQPTVTTKTSTAWEKPLNSETEDSKKASIITQSSTMTRERTSPRSPRPISNKQVSESSPQPRPTSKSPAPWPMASVRDEQLLALQTVDKPTPHRKFAKDFHAPRLTSDYRITASNPKALTSGPIAWPVTKRLERKRRSDVIIAVGGVAKSGESEIAGRMVEAFLLDKNEWRELGRMPSARNHHVVHFLNGFLYVVGGSDPHTEGDEFLKPVSSVLKYDIRVGKWSEALPMNAARIFHEVTALFGELYVVGGQDQDGRTLATVECYSPNTDHWRYVAPLPSARYAVAVTVYRGRLWVAGGFPEDHLAETSTVPRDVVCYNPFCDEWNSMTPLRVPRCHTSLLEMANKLYMIGGFVGDSNASDEKSQSMSTIEMYNESREAWEFVADLWQGRHDANTVTVGDKAYIVGGMEDENEDPLPNVECFDPVAMSWATGLAALPGARFGHACCVVPGDVPIKWPKS